MLEITLSVGTQVHGLFQNHPFEGEVVSIIPWDAGKVLVSIHPKEGWDFHFSGFYKDGVFTYCGGILYTVSVLILGARPENAPPEYDVDCRFSGSFSELFHETYKDLR